MHLFIIEEIYELFNPNELLIIQEYSKFNKEYVFSADFNKIQFIQEIIRGLRNRRIELNVPNSKKTNLIFLVENDAIYNVIKSSEIHFKNFGSEDKIEIFKNDKSFLNNEDISKYIQLVFSKCVLYIPLYELVDKEKEIERLEEEIKKNQFELDRATQLINNKNNVSKTSKDKIDKEKEKVDKYFSIIKELQEKLKQFKN